MRVSRGKRLRIAERIIFAERMVRACDPLTNFANEFSAFVGQTEVSSESHEVNEISTTLMHSL